jgi:hypothetical protein
VAVGENVTPLVLRLNVVFVVMLAGQMIVGGVVSTTVIVDWQEAMFPAASLAVHVIVVSEPYAN